MKLDSYFDLACKINSIFKKNMKFLVVLFAFVAVASCKPFLFGGGGG